MSANESPVRPSPGTTPGPSSRASPAEQSDAALISRVRAGDGAAYEQLYERHVAAAGALARHLAGPSPAESAEAAEAAEAAVDAAVAETFARILVALRHGAGPQAGFRTYLLASLRRTIGAHVAGDRRPPASVSEFGPYDPAGPYVVDPALRGLETNLIARAFLSLPERWQAVLWHTEVEGARPAAVAPLLGLTPNGVAGLAYAAREGLRQSYLQLHLADSARRTCRPPLDKLAAYIRGGLAERDTVRVERHLAGCQDCAAIYAELADVKAVLRAVVGPLVLGRAAAGYLAGAAGRAGGSGTDGAADAESLAGLRRAWRRRAWRRGRASGVRTAGTHQ